MSSPHQNVLFRNGISTRFATLVRTYVCFMEGFIQLMYLLDTYKMKL